MIEKRVLLAILFMLCGASWADDVVITVTGKVVPLPCTVDTQQLNLQLGNIYASALAKPGSSGSWVPGTIKLSNCPSVTSGITASFSGQPGSSFYKNNGTAKNVEIQLQTSSGADLSNGKVQTLTVTQQRTAEIPVKVRMYSATGKATDGTVQATINVTYTYQ
ncbi:fimbrial protein [Serratia fonticola]